MPTNDVLPVFGTRLYMTTMSSSLSVATEAVRSCNVTTMALEHVWQINKATTSAGGWLEY